jgi:putative transposase
VLRRQGVRPEAIVTDKLASYGAAAKEPSLSDRHQPTGQAANSRAENAHLPVCRRERKKQRPRARDQSGFSSRSTERSKTPSTFSPI